MNKSLVTLVATILTFVGCASGAGYELRTPDQRFNKMEALAQQYVRIAYPVPPLAEDANALQTQLHERKVNQRAKKIENVQIGLSTYSAFIKVPYGDGIYDEEIDIRILALKLASNRVQEGMTIPKEEISRLRGTLTFLDILGVESIQPLMKILGAQSLDEITEEISTEEVPVN